MEPQTRLQDLQGVRTESQDQTSQALAPRETRAADGANNAAVMV
jgi:hypothetical protein